MMTGVPKNELSLISLIFKNKFETKERNEAFVDTPVNGCPSFSFSQLAVETSLLFSLACHYVALFQEFVDTPVNGHPPLFRIDSVHQMETSLSRALLVY
jgi:hypothetical protein